MKYVKILFSVIVIICIIASATCVFAEDAEEAEDTLEEEQTEEEQSVFYYECDREVSVEDSDTDGVPLTEEEKMFIADGYQRDASEIEFMIWRGYDEESDTFVLEPLMGAPGGDGNPCNGNHQFRNVRITAIRHCFFDTDPRCLECNYSVTYCTREGCDYYEEDFDFSANGGIKRISCHSGTALKDWEIYDNYLNFERDAAQKISGYTTDSVTVYFTRSFAMEHDSITPSDFPEIADKIASVDYSKAARSALIRFSEGDGGALSAGKIDLYIGALKYLRSLSFVGEVVPAYRTEKFEPQTEQKDTAQPGTDQKETMAPPVQETPSAVPAAATTVTSSDAAPVNDAPETPPTGAAGGNTWHNPPTGDELYLLVFAAAAFLSVMIILIRLKRSKKNRV